jgi:hypothetical protein
VQAEALKAVRRTEIAKPAARAAARFATPHSVAAPGDDDAGDLDQTEDATAMPQPWLIRASSSRGFVAQACLARTLRMTHQSSNRKDAR